MAGFVEVLTDVCQEELDRLAQQIMFDLKRACPKKSGDAASGIHIEVDSPTSRFIGNDTSSEAGLHLYYADQGNGGPGRVIRPTRSQALRLTDGFGRTKAFRAYVHGYEGSHFVKQVADKYR